MIVIVAVAIYGAALGLWMRPGARAVIFAAISIGAMQYAAICLARLLLDSPGMAKIAWMIESCAGDRARDVVPTASTAAFAAAISAFVAALTQSDERRRRLRSVAAIED
jgi:hypothetical protein